MRDVSKAFAAFSKLFYLEGDDEAGIKALGVNMDDVEEGWDKKKRKKGDNPIRAEIINIILRCADAIGAKVAVIDWSGVTRGGKYMIEQFDLDKISVLVQGLYHIKFCGVHQQYQGRGRDAVRRSIIANTMRIATLSAALTDFCVKNNYNCQPSVLQALSGHQFVEPSYLLLQPDDSIRSPRQVEDAARQAAKDARESIAEDDEVEVVEVDAAHQSIFDGDEIQDEEVEVVEVEATSKVESDGRVDAALVAIITEAALQPDEPSSSSAQFPCLNLLRMPTNAETCSAIMDNFGLITLEDGDVASVVPECTELFRERRCTLLDARWDESFRLLGQYAQVHGDCRVKKSKDKKLYYWVNKQRTSGKAGNLSQDRMHRLDEIGFLWDASEFAGGSRDDGKWDDMFSKLQQYKHDHGTCRVKKSKDQKLYSWVIKQRRELRKNGNMPEDRIRRLNGINFE